MKSADSDIILGGHYRSASQIRPLNCLFNSLFGLTIRKMSKLCIMAPFRWKSTGRGWISQQLSRKFCFHHAMTSSWCSTFSGVKCQMAVSSLKLAIRRKDRAMLQRALHDCQLLEVKPEVTPEVAQGQRMLAVLEFRQSEYYIDFWYITVECNTLSDRDQQPQS